MDHPGVFVWLDVILANKPVLQKIIRRVGLAKSYTQRDNSQGSLAVLLRHDGARIRSPI